MTAGKRAFHQQYTIVTCEKLYNAFIKNGIAGFQQTRHFMFPVEISQVKLTAASVVSVKLDSCLFYLVV